MVVDEALEAALGTGYWSQESAALVIAAWERSGETLTAFARRYDLRRDRLSRWRDRLRRAQESAGPAFHPVMIRESPDEPEDRSGIAPSTQTTELELLLGGGRRITIRPGFDPATLLALVRVLEGDRC
jgi:transposase-like protein